MKTSINHKIYLADFGIDIMRKSQNSQLSLENLARPLVLPKKAIFKSPPCFLMSDFYANNLENNMQDNFFNHEIKIIFSVDYVVIFSR